MAKTNSKKQKSIEETLWDSANKLLKQEEQSRQELLKALKNWGMKLTCKVYQNG
jgi:hypothetical protein